MLHKRQHEFHKCTWSEIYQESVITLLGFCFITLKLRSGFSVKNPRILYLLSNLEIGSVFILGSPSVKLCEGFSPIWVVFFEEKMGDGLLLSFLILVCCLSGLVIGKECTNTPTQPYSHQFRYELSKNESMMQEMISHYHVIQTEESTWMDLLPRKLLKREASSAEEWDWAMLYRNLKGLGSGDERQDGGGDFLTEVSLHDVRLEPDSWYGIAQQTNLEYLLILDVDRLVWSFRKYAGMSTPGEPYGGWESPNQQLRGHFVGHYMSASAQMWASTHNDTLHKKMTSVVDALYACQKKIDTGYLSAFPSEFFDLFEEIKDVWAPYYTIHKIMAGLLDQYSLAGNSKALDMVVWMAEYFGNRVKNVILKYSIERHWASLNEETGGMNDVLYNIYTITGDKKHLILAHLFDKPCFLGLLAVQADSLSQFHANTHIPIVVGAQKRYEITGDSLYKEISTFFMDTVNSSHTYATGGTSVSEHWSDPKRLADTLTTENEETCTTYNMLKISRNMFRWTRQMAYADYYERALINGILSVQRGRDPGVMIYMLPLGSGRSKAHSYHGWGTQFDSFWCCYGTGIESFSKLGDSIYFEEKGSTPGLYLIQFIPSSFNWKNGGIILNQKLRSLTSQDSYFQVSLTISSNKTNTQSSNLNLRIPSWTSKDGLKAVLNSQNLDLPYPGNFLSVTRKWTSDDKIDLQFPISLRTEAIQDDRAEYSVIQAILFGPYLLAGLTSNDWDIDATNANSVSDWVNPVPASYNSQLISLTQKFSNHTFAFSNSNNTLTMDLPVVGTDSAVYATFRLIVQASKHTHGSSNKIVIGQYVQLEPIDLPGMVVVHKGQTHGLAITATTGLNSVFRVVAGLDGKANTVSLESKSKQGCFVYSGVAYTAGKSLTLQCQGSDKPESFQQATSFTLIDGFKQYHPISFVAKGVKRNFLLEPLLSLRDESYTVYFNIKS